MRTHVATITERGQVTIPAAVRHLLHLEPRDRVVFEVDDAGAVRLTPAGFTLESAFGSVTPINRPEDFDAIIDAAKAEKVKRSAHESAEP